jgi:hypothetical protein
MKNLMYWALTQGGYITRWGWIHPHVRRDFQNELDIQAFEKWQRTPDLVDVRILEKISEMVDETTSH